MIASKKISLIILSVFFLTSNGIAQEKKDIGIIIAAPNSPGIAIEYRKPLGEKFRLKFGLTGSANPNQFGFRDGTIVSVSDSIVTERFFRSNSVQGGIRFGVERRLKTSMFSVGGDFNLDYKNRKRSNYNRSTYLFENGIWEEGAHTTQFSPFDDPAASRITEHYLVPSFRLSMNMDIPIGKRFLINLAVANTLGLPIYMGASDIRDPLEEFIGTPPSTFDFDTDFYVGLRYIIGGGKG